MLILASQSPRRRELLERAGYRFTVRAPAVTEVRAAGEEPEEYVLRLAKEKAWAVDAGPAEWVLAADTTVVAAHHVLEKPNDAADARRMLRLLAGRVHQVLTGVCLRHGTRTWEAVESTAVRFTSLSDSEIDAYVASGEPLDKAGAYAIQGLASNYIDRIEGCYFNVVGLPVARFHALCREAGYQPASG
jgi:septum formation protein